MLMRVMDLREALALATERQAKVEVIESAVDVGYANDVAKKLGWRN